MDKGKVEPFVNSAKSQMPLRVPADILNEIPTLRSSKYGSFSFLRHRNRHYPQIVAWFGSDFRNKNDKTQTRTLSSALVALSDFYRLAVGHPARAREFR